jgi:hypothetical protein
VTQRVGRGIALLFHDLGTGRGWVFSSTPRPHFTPGKDPVPIVQEAGWAPGPVWTGAENLSLTGIRSPDHPARSSVAIPTELPGPQFLVTTSRKCERIIMNCLTHSETQTLVSSVSSFAALVNSMRVYAPSCITFQHSKCHTTTMRGYFTAGRVFFSRGKKKWHHETKEHWTKSSMVHSRIRTARIKYNDTRQIYTRVRLVHSIARKILTPLKANYRTSHFSFQSFHTV